MNPLKLGLLLITVCLLAAGTTVYYFKKNPQHISSLPMPLRGVVEGASTFFPDSLELPDSSKLTENAPQSFSELSEDAKLQSQDLLDRAKVAGGELQNVLGVVTATGSSEPVQERLLEYGQYQYCKQVVAEWEKK